MIIETKSAKETYDLGKKIGSHAKAGEVYTLVGDLGVGKTVFTQGLAKGLGIEEPISSPTFTIVQVYDDGRLPFHHFDVYRIGDIEEMDEIGFEDYVYGDGVPVHKDRLEKELMTNYDIAFAPAHMNQQRAAAVGMLGIQYYKEGKTETAMEHKPDYLRVSQAEREREERLKAEKTHE